MYWYFSYMFTKTYVVSACTQYVWLKYFQWYRRRQYHRPETKLHPDWTFLTPPPAPRDWAKNHWHIIQMKHTVKVYCRPDYNVSIGVGGDWILYLPLVLGHTCPKIWNSSCYYLLMCLKYCCMANSVDPDQMPHSVASHLGLHCLQRPICPHT